jgi:hypothetical protein
MKHFLIFVVALGIFGPAYVYGQECDLKIRDGFAAQDLGRILSCFDQRLKSLESTRSIKPQSGSTSSIRNAEKYDAGDFSVFVRASSRTQDSIKIALSIQNTTTKTILLSICSGEGGSTVFDERTVSTRAIESKQLKGIAIHHYCGSNSPADYTPLPANTGRDVVVTLPDAAAMGNSLNLNLDLRKLEESRDIYRQAVPLSVVVR